MPLLKNAHKDLNKCTNKEIQVDNKHEEDAQLHLL